MRPLARTAVLATTLLALCTPARPARAGDLAVRLSAPVERPHAVYLELLGKGGLWGFGYDYRVNGWLGAGLTGSFSVVDGQRVLGVSPYLAAYPLGSGRHRGFLHVGPQLFHVSTPSPVPEWTGTSSTGLGAEASAGYEYRNGILVRVYAMAAAGKDGVAPWLGVSIGWTF